MKEKPEMKEIFGKKYYYLWKAAVVLGISDRSLSREINKKNIRYLNYLGGKYILPEWCDEYIMHRIVQPRKIIAR